MHILNILYQGFVEINEVAIGELKFLIRGGYMVVAELGLNGINVEGGSTKWGENSY